MITGVGMCTAEGSDGNLFVESVTASEYFNRRVFIKKGFTAV